VVIMGRQHVSDGHISVKHIKTNAKLRSDCTPRFKRNSPPRLRA
jgi:hypothetical protein